MAGEIWSPGESYGYSWGTGTTQCYNWTREYSRTNSDFTVAVGGCVNVTGGGMSQYGVECQVGHGGGGGVSASWESNTGVLWGNGTEYASITRYYTFPRSHADYTVTTWTKYWGTTVSGYGGISQSYELYNSITIPAKASYTVSYNANGGSGAPSSQTKWYGETLTLSTTVPTRDGYDFAGWGTSASATGVSYAAGGSYTGNASITLYAVWTVNKSCTIAYNANGGSGAPSSQTHVYLSTSRLSTVKPTRDGYAFLGWSTSSTATKATYLAGGRYTNDSFTDGATITLYAVWAEITNIYMNVPSGTVSAVHVNVPSGSSFSAIYYKV